MPRANAVGPDHVDIAWMSITNIHRQMGSFARLADGDTRRIPESAFHTGRGGYSDTDNPRKPDVAVVTRVLEARGGPENVRPLFTGHGQRGHAFDTATWSKLSDAPSIGSQIPLFESWRRTCRSSAAVPERMVIAKGMNRRVMRRNHRVESRRRCGQERGAVRSGHIGGYSGPDATGIRAIRNKAVKGAPGLSTIQLIPRSADRCADAR